MNIDFIDFICTCRAEHSLCKKNRCNLINTKSNETVSNFPFVCILLPPRPLKTCHHYVVGTMLFMPKISTLGLM